jgi:PAS domain S-box-containing protein
LLDDRRRAKMALSNFSAIVALCVVTFCAAANNAGSAEEPRAKRVLIISTGSRLAPGFALVDQQLLRTFERIPSAPIETYAENLDLIRFPSERFQQIFTDYLTAKYAEHPPDLVIMVYVGNLGLAGNLLPKLFPGTPIIAAGLTEEELRTNQFDSLVTGIAQRVDPRATLDLIHRLQPEVRRVVVIGGTAEVDRQVIQRVKEAAASVTGRLELDFWDSGSMAQLHQSVTALPAQTAILFARMFRDGAGQATVSTEVARSVAQRANVPVYVLTDTALGTGAVGGSVLSIEAMGKRTGEIARLVLNGTKPASLPFEIRADTVPTFDWRALKRWGISEGRLPPGAVVRFKPLSIWEQYQGYMVAVLIIIGIEAAIIGDLLLQRARRRRAEAGLLESQQFTELATEAGQIGLWARDLVRGYLWANPRLRFLLGLGEQESVSVDQVLARVHPDDRARVMSVIERTQENGTPFDVEFRTVGLPGVPERWLAARGQIVRAPQGILRRMGTMIDVTDRKSAEEKLWQSEENFRRLVETTAAVIWQADTETWMFTYVGPQAVRLLGYPLEQWYEKDFWMSHLHPDDRERAINTCLTMSRSAQDFDFEYRMIRASGAVVWIHDFVNCPDHNGKPMLRGLMLDVTERKQAEEALESERKFLRQVIDTDPNFVFAKDREGRFTLANKAVADAYGTTVDNLIGRTDADFNPNKEEVKAFRQDDQEVIDTMQERFIAEERVTDATGRVHWLQTVKRPIIESDGSAKQVLGACTDITRRKETEAELREKRAELAHVSRLTTMGELAASLAHELNQPLTAILSNAQAALRFLSSEPPDMEEVREILQDIVKDNSRAGEVIRRMRALVKKEEIEFVTLDLAGLIRDVVALVHSDAILQNVKISLILDENLPTVLGDKVQLQQVVLNLLLNAFDAMKDCPPLKREVELRAECYGPSLVKAAVSDRGTGLSTDKLDKIFQPFYSTKGEGLGMGLSICRSIIEAHGGHLWAENNAGRGATFYFTVPQVERRRLDSRLQGI